MLPIQIDESTMDVINQIKEQTHMSKKSIVDVAVRRYKDYKLAVPVQQTSDIVSGAQLWCNITNAIIRKYKPMVEKNPEQAIRELQTIEDLLTRLDYISPDFYY